MPSSRSFARPPFLPMAMIVCVLETTYVLVLLKLTINNVFVPIDRAMKTSEIRHLAVPHARCVNGILFA
jgi:hypothetical protein